MEKEEQLFEQFLAFESRSLKDFATATGQSYSTIKKYSSKSKWREKAAEYDAKKSATTITEDLATAALAASNSRLLAASNSRLLAASNSRLLAFQTANVAAENTGTKNADVGAFEVQQVPPADSATLLSAFSQDTPEKLVAAFNHKVKQGDSAIKKGLIFCIDAGKDLLAAKKLVGHGDWENWLQSKIDYPIRRAQKLMQVADRFGFLTDNPDLVERVTVSQLLELLSLSAGEEQNFLEKLSAEGKILADMTTKDTRAEVKAYNEELAAAREMLEKEKARAENLQGQLVLFGDKAVAAEKELTAAKKTIYQQTAENNDLIKKIKELEDKPPVTVEIEKPIVPADYAENKKALEESNARILSLQAQLDAATATSSETESLKKEIAQLQASQAVSIERAAVFNVLDTVSNLLSSVDTKKFISEYAAEYPKKFSALRKIFL